MFSGAQLSQFCRVQGDLIKPQEAARTLYIGSACGSSGRLDLDYRLSRSADNFLSYSALVITPAARASSSALHFCRTRVLVPELGATDTATCCEAGSAEVFRLHRSLIAPTSSEVFPGGKRLRQAINRSCHEAFCCFGDASACCCLSNASACCCLCDASACCCLCNSSASCRFCKASACCCLCDSSACCCLSKASVCRRTYSAC